MLNGGLNYKVLLWLREYMKSYSDYDFDLVV
jgi:hypothetical protein